MATVTPTTFAEFRANPTTATWVNPYTGDFSDAGSVTKGDYKALDHLQFYFASVDPLDSWASNIPGILHTAIDNRAGAAQAGVSAVTSVPGGATGVITFNGGGNNMEFVLHVWSRG